MSKPHFLQHFQATCRPVRPEGERAAALLLLIGQQMLNAGMIVGSALAERSQQMHAEAKDSKLKGLVSVSSKEPPVEVEMPKKSQVELTQPKEPPVTKTLTDAVKAVEENPKLIKGEPENRRAQVGEHEIVEVPDSSLPSGIGCEFHSPPPYIKVPCPKGMGTTKQGPFPWETLMDAAEQPTPRQNTDGFRSNSKRIGDREVIVIEGTVGDVIDPKDSMAKYGSIQKDEHATHAVGMQLGENLPEGLTSAPATFNLSEMKVIENTIRQVSDNAKSVSAQVETKTILRVHYVPKGNDKVPLLVGIQREAWVRLPGSDKPILFVDFRVGIDLSTRVVTVEKNWTIRPLK